ncbi:S8 family peptidase [Flavobacterium sp.]|uniref:S8 family peptidase n=1 Tax=Flavobacterium sp. TaxID=239 RepID=UPI00286AE553|nr:S8 family peptidase [Flavobacterium sp.]
MLTLIFPISCKSIKQTKNEDSATLHKKASEEKFKFWHHEDYQENHIPGISLNKFYINFLRKVKVTEVVVAVIDTQIDSKHEDLNGQIWVNKKEIPENRVDDDGNGYIDDVNGWSFTGTKSGGYVVWSNFEYVRVIREWESVFKDKTENQILSNDIENYKEYKRACLTFEKKLKFYKNWSKSSQHAILLYPIIKDTLKYFFPKEDYTYKQLDSMYKIYKINDKSYRQRRDDGDKDLGALIDYRMVSLEVNHISLKDLQNNNVELDSILYKNLNINFDERLFIGDNPKILEKGYGNNKISSNIINHRTIQDHNTKVSSIIAANRENNIGVKGFSSNIKIMPLNISPSGDEHDKDITMAIRYAVDNGAKVINMSIGKEFSLHKDWVFEAYKYAELHNVLIVHSSGNDGLNVDERPYYPSDYDYNGNNEVCNNFINVGSTTKNLDSTFVSSFSNYGKKNVDLFAPGEQIYTAIPNNKYDFDSGTSLAAPMVSGTAALIWLYYPKLTSSQVKQIILDSGTAYDIEVIVPGTKDKKVKFSELSKSGKVLNVYKAMKMAEEVSRKKR